MLNKHLFILCFSLLLFSGCTKPACTVGTIRITDKAIQQRSQVSEIYYPGSGKPYVGLSQLIKAALAEELLSKLNRPIDAAAVEAEAQRIDTNTKDPGTLARIKDVFGKDRKAYLDVFVRPTYVERVLYAEVFLKPSDIHIQQKFAAQELFQQAEKDPASFSTMAALRGLVMQQMRVTSRGIVPSEKKNGVHEERLDPEAAQRILKAIASARTGSMVSNILEWPESFQVMRLVQKKGDGAVVESVSIPKQSFDIWFWSLASRVPVIIFDSDLKNKLLKEVSWAANLNMR